ncbi:hypothetical protein C2W62_06245 [Candidatus Entotheonella serta]|nr:hypothetical protein C2W62_06245 [Candidatus Entotheonella serta]
MDLYAVADQIVELLQSRGKLTYRVLKLQFKLDDETLEALKEEILYAQSQVVDDKGKGLIWTGEMAPKPEPETSSQPARSTVQEQLFTQGESPPPEPHIPDAERRQLTVMFCDLVDSTSLSGQLDPEDLRDVIRAYPTTCDEIVQRLHGHIAQYLGDGLLVYFGYPQAHEDDAQRAVLAGLGMVDVIATLNPHLERDHGIELAIRIGIHTGLVVVGEMGGRGRQEQLALGKNAEHCSSYSRIRNPGYGGDE